MSTGAFLTRFNTSLLGSIKNSARTAKAVQEATVERIGIASLSGNQASVLALGRLQVADTTHPGGHTSPLTLGVTLQNSGGSWRISDMTDLGTNGTLPATPPGTPGLTAAVTAGAREVVDLLTYTRNNFAADLNRALGGLAAPLRAAQQTQGKSLESAMLSGGFDYAGRSARSGRERVGDVGADARVRDRVAASHKGEALASGTQRFEVGVTSMAGRCWSANTCR